MKADGWWRSLHHESISRGRASLAKESLLRLRRGDSWDPSSSLGPHIREVQLRMTRQLLKPCCYPAKQSFGDRRSPAGAWERGYNLIAERSATIRQCQQHDWIVRLGDGGLQVFGQRRQIAPAVRIEIARAVCGCVQLGTDRLSAGTHRVGRAVG